MMRADLKDIVPSMTDRKSSRIIASNVNIMAIVREEDGAFEQSVQIMLRRTQEESNNIHLAFMSGISSIIPEKVGSPGPI